MVSVSVSLTLFVLLFVAATVNCEDVGCKKGTRAASVQLNPGDSFSFKTVNNRRNKYRGNQRCTASYSLSGGCEAALITCATFNTRSNADCTTGDYLIGKDSNGEEVVRFCNKDGPQDLEVDQDFSMTFVSDRRKSAEGIDCVVSCVTEPLSTTEASTAETTATASSSTATFPTTTTEGSYTPGSPGAPWTEQDALIIKAKLAAIMYVPAKYNPLSHPESLNIDITLENLEYRREIPYAAKFLRLGFHGCMKYKDGSGGCNGCMNLQKMEDSLDWRTYDLLNEGRGLSGHEGLLTTVKVLEQIYTDPAYPPEAPALDKPMPEKGISRADLWAFSAILATEIGLEQNNKNCAVDRKGEEESCLVYPVGNQRNDAHPGKCESSMKLNIFKTGRADCTDFTGVYAFNATIEEVLPVDHGNGDETLDYYNSQFGLNSRESVVIQGAHSLGKPHRWNTGFDRYWTKKNQKNLNTQYYENIVSSKPGSTGYKLGDCPYVEFGDKDGNPAPVTWVPENNYLNKGMVVPRHQWRKVYYGCDKCKSVSYKGMDICPSIGGKTYEQACSSHLADVKPSCADNNGTPLVDCCRTEAPFCDESEYEWRVTEDMMLNSDIGLYLNFTREADGRQTGCPGLDKQDAWKTRDTGKIMYTGGEPGCSLNTQTHQIIEEFAEDDTNWILEFPIVLQKMLNNGYEADELHAGPAVFDGVICDTVKGIYQCS